MNEGTTFLKSEKEMKLRKWFWQLITLFSLNEKIFFLDFMVAKVTTRHETTMLKAGYSKQPEAKLRNFSWFWSTSLISRFASL